MSNVKKNIKSGFVLAYASVMSDAIIGAEKPFSKFEAWMWILFNACRKKEGRWVMRKMGGKEHMIFEPYGCLAHSQNHLAKEWGWTRQITRTYVERLQKNQKVTKKLTKNLTKSITILEINNFKAYQHPNSNYQPGNQPGNQPPSNQLATNREPASNHNYNTLTREHENTLTGGGAQETHGANPQPEVGASSSPSKNISIVSEVSNPQPTIVSGVSNPQPANVTVVSNVTLKKSNSPETTHGASSQQSPAETARGFFRAHENKIARGERYQFYANKFPSQEILKQFVRYWTEPTSSGDQAKWEAGRFWELEARIESWLEKEKKFNGNRQGAGKQANSQAERAARRKRIIENLGESS